jgi:hypothetical protein
MFFTTMRIGTYKEQIRFGGGSMRRMVEMVRVRGGFAAVSDMAALVGLGLTIGVAFSLGGPV